MDKTIETRFWKKVKKGNVNECWIWTASCRTKYGSIKVNNKLIDAHRLSYLISNGYPDLTSKDYICHKCDNPICVNPNHLFLGNAKINSKDAYDKGRVILPKTKIGHKPSYSLTTNEIAKEIFEKINSRRLLKTKLRLKEISIEYNISYNSIRDISCGRTYINK